MAYQNILNKEYKNKKNHDNLMNQSQNASKYAGVYANQVFKSGYWNCKPTRHYSCTKNTNLMMF